MVSSNANPANGEQINNKKTNKHSSSTGNADWLNSYDKLRKELNFNSPREVTHSSGRVSTGSIRTKDPHMVVLNGKATKKTVNEVVRQTPKVVKGTVGSCLTPRGDVMTNSEIKTPNAKSILGDTMRLRADSKPTIALEKNKFTQMLLQLNNGKSNPLISRIAGKTALGGRKPVVATHNNFG